MSVSRSSAAANDVGSEVEDTAERSTIADITSRIKVILGTEDRVHKDTLRDMCGDCSDREFGLGLHGAREQLRAECSVEFVPGAPGELVRAGAKQKLTRGRNFDRTASRKRTRAGAVYAAIDPIDLSDDDRARLQMAVDKNSTMSMRERQIAHMRKPLPMGNDERPEIPRRSQQQGKAGT